MSQKSSVPQADSFVSQVLKRDTARAAENPDRFRSRGFVTLLTVPLEGIPVAAVRTDHKVALAFHKVATPCPVLGVLRLLHRRCGGRRFLQSR